ncbi:MAG: thiamine-phosphate pyrophosphorylase, partial [Lentimonas sp.]
VGSFCGNSRHDGMTAGELGVDYVAFGPCGQTTLGDGRQAELELFEWWSTMIEVPVVAEGALTKELITAISPHTDFFGFGDEIWSTDNPLATFAALRSAIVA